MKSKHHLKFCTLCDRNVVFCATCGNNSCNGGSGRVDGKPCPDCDEAYQHDQLQIEGVFMEFSEV